MEKRFGIVQSKRQYGYRFEKWGIKKWTAPKNRATRDESTDFSDVNMDLLPSRRQLSPSRILSAVRKRRSDISPDARKRICVREVSTISLATKHYTISQDHTAGEETRRSHLFANFGRKHQRQPGVRGAPVNNPDCRGVVLADYIVPLYIPAIRMDSADVNPPLPPPRYPGFPPPGDRAYDADYLSTIEDQHGNNLPFNHSTYRLGGKPRVSYDERDLIDPSSKVRIAVLDTGLPATKDQFRQQFPIPKVVLSNAVDNSPVILSGLIPQSPVPNSAPSSPSYTNALEKDLWM
ncbi:hypothetical protein FSARC_13003 [Fusarium sarcochroum]|uniref:Clr5 domain-containing protein n=1 Tax=Fusarium sarcochroum TaxID=1208366 RepID=A0A8H4T493_9HYPO|nr:hypothetical protein FSARC_13003 [Fusarium sarcochroum]